MANAWLTGRVTNPPPATASNRFMDGLRAYLKNKQCVTIDTFTSCQYQHLCSLSRQIPASNLHRHVVVNERTTRPQLQLKDDQVRASIDRSVPALPLLIYSRH
jgi:hypothetical protein